MDAYGRSFLVGRSWTVIDGHGRSWTLIFGRTVMVGHGRSWMLSDAHGRSWTFMDAHGRFIFLNNLFDIITTSTQNEFSNNTFTDRNCPKIRQGENF